MGKYCLILVSALLKKGDWRRVKALVAPSSWRLVDVKEQVLEP